MLLVLYLFQFIDLCILLGCDYCDSIRGEESERCATPIITLTTGVGPVKAINLMRQHKTIEKVVDSIRKEGKVSN